MLTEADYAKLGRAIVETLNAEIDASRSATMAISLYDHRRVVVMWRIPTPENEPETLKDEAIVAQVRGDYTWK